MTMSDRSSDAVEGFEAARRQVASTPRILILLLALLVLVGFQTLEMSAQGSQSAYLETAYASIFPTTEATAYRQESRYKQRPIPPYNAHPPPRVHIPLDRLTNATREFDETCIDPKRWVYNKPDVNISAEFASQRIPLLIHSTSKTRCVHRAMTTDVNLWKKWPQYQYYLHDDSAVWTLLNQDWPEFPHLQIVVRCLNSMTAVADIWRLLILWEYGGIYVDLDTIPNAWTPEYIFPEDDAFFVVESFHAPSQYFMAATPHHPLIYYAIQQALLKTLAEINTQKIDAARTTGPFALLHAFELFTLDGGTQQLKPIPNGTYRGTGGKKARLVGEGGQQTSDAVIKRESMTRERKTKLYGHINMTHYHDELRRGRNQWKLGRSCIAIGFDLLLGPPLSYNQTEDHDRETVAGIS